MLIIVFFCAVVAQVVYGPYLAYKSNEPQVWKASVLVLADTSVELSAVYGSASATIYPRVIDTFPQNLSAYRFDLSFAVDPAIDRMTYSIGTQSFVVYITANNPNTALYSCNGFSSNDTFTSLWIDLKNKHAQNPFHLQIGGGDQIYLRGIWQLPSISKWLRNMQHVFFSPEMENEVSLHVWNAYLEHFSRNLFRYSLASIPYIYVLDDNDIYDGLGSLPASLTNSPVIVGITKIAKRFYLLFQQHITEELKTADGYFGENSFSALRVYNGMGFMMTDTRLERTRDSLLTSHSKDMLVATLKNAPHFDHLLFVAGSPMLFPSLDIIKLGLSPLSSEFPLPFRKQIQRSFPGLFTHFKEPNALDDILDQFTSDNHRKDLQWFISMLQTYARQKHSRVTLFTGDVHSASLGHFRSKQNIQADVDPHFMVHILSSGIASEPATDKITNLFNLLPLHEPNNKTSAKVIVIGKQNFVNRRNWAALYPTPLFINVQLYLESGHGTSDVVKTTIPNLLRNKNE